MANDSGLVCRDVRLVRRTTQGDSCVVLDGITAEFPAGSLSLITGSIGAGKTTFLHILCTILRPSAGVVEADGAPVSRFTSVHRDRWRRQAGLALQAAHFFEELTALENVMLPLVPRALSLSQARARAFAELERFGVQALARRSMGGLSGGERQRITLARALVGRPRYLFADEPTAHQDTAGSALILDRLAAARADGVTVVVVSHDARVRDANVSDRVWQLAAGRLDVAS